uniref:acetyl-CoA C-acyltransferase n=1 Tax=Arcella intermedia TaxID=1963864 RepID=A0A6B2L5X2_9EUKA
MKDTHWTTLLEQVLANLLTQNGLAPSQIEDVAVGVTLSPKAATLAKVCLFNAGFPETTSVYTVNRKCASSLEALVNISNQIRWGMIRIGIAAGVESMSAFGFEYGRSKESNDIIANLNKPDPSLSAPRFKVYHDGPQLSKDCLISNGITAENVASRFGVSREAQDAFALSSHVKALKATKAGEFKAEIVPIKTNLVGRDGATVEVVVREDDGSRDTTMAALAALKPAFKKDGSCTAGNSSQVSDGAAAALLTTRAEAQRLGLPVLGRMLASAVAGVPPEIMGIGPAKAIPLAVQRAGLQLSDIDIFEINEAFASQALYCAQELDIPLHKVNPLGGAIALGHPLGCTGVRLVSTLLHYLRRHNLRYGVVSMCIATGMGMAAVFQSEPETPHSKL